MLGAAITQELFADYLRGRGFCRLFFVDFEKVEKNGERTERVETAV